MYGFLRGKLSCVLYKWIVNIHLTIVIEVEITLCLRQNLQAEQEWEIKMSEDYVTMAHGSGGLETEQLISAVFSSAFGNEYLSQMEDSTIVCGSHKIALTTDSFVVTPIEFPGGDIGRLCICGTVNDLLMRGAIPQYITCGFIIEEGASMDSLKKIAQSMGETAKEANVLIVAGDTKVVNGKGDIYINTTGVGFIDEEQEELGAKCCKPGDCIIVSGKLGEHHAAILSSRMNIENQIQSDCAPLNQMVAALLEEKIQIHAMRDVTRGGLATVLKELATASQNDFMIREDSLPVSSTIKDFCGLLGLDPLYMGNEGKMVAVVSNHHAQKALEIIKRSPYGNDAAIIGQVEDGDGKLLMKTSIGGLRNLEVLTGEGLPRIC